MLFHFDANYIMCVMVPGLVLGLFAQWKVKSAFAKWDRIVNERGLTGVQTAKIIMENTGLDHVSIAHVQGDLTDFYDPRDQSMHLSDSSTRKPSVAAMAVVAHELGHAEQDKVGNTMLRFRAKLAPVANLGSNLGVWIVIFGLMLRLTGLTWVGILLFGLAVLFTLVTLPVELDASRRAKQHLRELNLVSMQEEQGVNAVLDAAALTYVAAAASAVLTMMYYIGLAGRRR